ncbi:MAG TPA: META domain-containing protein [Ignavibacteria bacterium]|nr:META domain-containing protein [Ignavibacteria bacterium]
MDKFTYLILLIIPVIIISCSSGKENTIGSEASLSNIKWVAVNIGGQSVTNTDYTLSAPWIVMKVNATVFDGNTGCNTMKGIVHATNTSIYFNNITTTKVACTKGDEGKFLRALTSADSWTKENDMLYLYSGKVVTAVFKREEQQD